VPPHLPRTRGHGPSPSRSRRDGGPALITVHDCERIVELAGRRIAYLDLGDPNGVPVVYAHTTPGSPFDVDMFGGSDEAARAGVRLIAPARPGVWRSDTVPARRVEDWADDLGALAAHLGLDRVGVFAYSGGAASALAAALARPDLVGAVALVAPVDHRDPSLLRGVDLRSRALQWAAVRAPHATRALFRAVLAVPGKRSQTRLGARWRTLLPPTDRHDLGQDQVADGFIRRLETAFERGARGPQEDMARAMLPWPFDPRDVRVPVHIWQGDRDTIGATPAVARRLHGEIDASTLTIVPQGHLSVFTRCAGDVLRQLVTSLRG